MRRLRKGISVVPIPGAAASYDRAGRVRTADGSVLFRGFPPGASKMPDARSWKELAQIPATLIFYEAPHRISAALRDAIDVLGDREGVVAA